MEFEKSFKIEFLIGKDIQHSTLPIYLYIVPEKSRSLTEKPESKIFLGHKYSCLPLCL